VVAFVKDYADVLRFGSKQLRLAKGLEKLAAATALCLTARRNMAMHLARGESSLPVDSLHDLVFV